MEKISLDDAIRAIVKDENNLLFSKLEAVFQDSERSEHNQKPMNFDEAREYLSCSRSYLYKMTSNQNIPHAKRGKRLVFSKKSLDEWLLKNKVKTVTEIQEEADNYLNSINKNSKI